MSFRNPFAISLTILLFISCSNEEVHLGPQAPEEIDLVDAFYVEINLKDRSDDTFKVSMYMDNLTDGNAVFQFPATVPGTYDIFDIGRYVSNVKAYDKNNKELPIEQTSQNQWTLSEPENTYRLEYEVAETFDTPVTENSIYKMAGTSLEDDHTLLNTFDVLGYPTGLKERDYYLHVKYPSGWDVGTSLPFSNGYYFATDYDKLVDNPLLLGEITSSTTTVDNAQISVFTYSKADLIQSSQILADIELILADASAFLNGLPVDRYSFLYLFDMFNSGALEHSYSSVYVLMDQPYTPGYGQSLKNIAAHEFFHIVTPLNIHSEIIADFNFAVPTPSEHLWLYEGVTEWAAHMMQFRNGRVTLANLLNRFRNKKANSDFYNASISLSEMSLTCYTPEGGSQFGNVYNKGALVAALLDIRLLELSNGTRGLRELILELIEIYGPENAFSDATFFATLTEMTYPEVEDFINRYIKGTDPLPLTEYFNKIGITYDAVSNTFAVVENPTPEQQFLLEKWSVNF